MINLAEQIINSNFIHAADALTYNYNKSSDLYSQSEFRNDVHTEADFKAICGRKWKKDAAILIAMIDIYKYISGRKEMHELPISSHGALTNIYKTVGNTSNALKLAVKVDLLKCISSEIRFNAGDDNKCKIYILNKNVQDLIISICISNHITHKNYIKNNIQYTIGTTFAKSDESTLKMPDLRDFNIRINSKLRLSIPLATDEQIINSLCLNYPQITDYISKANAINEEFFYNEKYKLGIQFQPKVTRSKGGLITKLSIRATNGICNLKEHDNCNDSGRIWRKDFLKEYFGTNDYLEFDVTSSIFRLTNFLNNDVWLDNSIDLYPAMYGRQFKNNDERTAYKKFAMKLYFGRSAGVIRTNICNKDSNIKNNYSIEDIDNVIEDMMERMLNAIGPSWDSEIFLHESCIYMDLLESLLRDGIDVVQVYDGFYVKKNQVITSNKILSDICQSKLKDIISKYKSKYITNNNNNHKNK